MVRWVDTKEEDEVRWILDDANEARALRAFEATVNREEKSKSGAYTTAETVLSAYQDPGVIASADSCEITAEALLDGLANTLYVCAPTHEQERLQPLFAAMIMQLVTAVYERAGLSGRPLERPLLIVLDECANIAPLRDLGKIASTGAGQGIQLVTVFQDMAQVNAVYGRDIAPTIASNHRAKILLRGISDADTLDYAARLLGDEPVTNRSTTTSPRGERATTESTHYRTLLPPNALRQMRQGEALLVYGAIPPARITLRPWFRDRALRALAEPMGGSGNQTAVVSAPTRRRGRRGSPRVRG